MAEWILPISIKRYDVIGAFKVFDRIEWKQGNKFEIGDHVYIYVRLPEGAIRYLCAVTKINIAERNMKDKDFIIDGSGVLNADKYMELIKIEEFNTHLLKGFHLEENGMKEDIQGPLRITDPVMASYIYASTTTRLGQKETNGPDSDHTLREITLILLRAYRCPVPRKYLTNIIYAIGKVASGNLTVPVQQLQSEKKIIRHPDNRLQINDTDKPNYFYVFQNRMYDKESKEGYLIANKQKGNIRRQYWTNLSLVKKGDVIFHAKDQFCVAVSIAKTDSTTKDQDDNGRESWFVRTDYYAFPHPIKPKDYWQILKPLQPQMHAPFDKNGNGNQGYLFQITEEMARVILDATAGMISERRTGGAEEIPDIDKEEEKLYKQEDDILQDELSEDPLDDIDDGFEYEGKPKLRDEPEEVHGRRVYPRNAMTSKNALAHAHFKCEIDSEHRTFIRKSSDKPFTEAHHLIPMAFSDQFGVSLDVEENIVSLCCTCHRNIHHGRDQETLIHKLYNDRKTFLYKVGINISIEELLKMYKL